MKRNKGLSLCGDYPVKPWSALPTQDGCRLDRTLQSVETSSSCWPVDMENVHIIGISFQYQGNPYSSYHFTREHFTLWEQVERMMDKKQKAKQQTDQFTTRYLKRVIINFFDINPVIKVMTLTFMCNTFCMRHGLFLSCNKTIKNNYPPNAKYPKNE